MSQRHRALRHHPRSSAGRANPTPLPENEQAVVEEHLPLRSPMVYEVVRQEGENELRRPLASLWWSGIAAGIGISTSVLTEALLHGNVPEPGWRSLVASFGYTIGFVIVVIGRLQLFTENTITAVLPLFANWSRMHFVNTLRLWGVVLAANLIGVFGTAVLFTHAGLVSDPALAMMLEVSHDAASHSVLDAMLLGVPAGFLVAAIVWILPNAEGSELLVVVMLTYVMALGDFTHVVVGSGELFLLLFDGTVDSVYVMTRIIAIMVGNVIGGTGLFALLAYGQVRSEM